MSSSPVSVALRKRSRRWAAALVLAVLLAAAFPSQCALAQGTATVGLITIHSEIQPATADFFTRGIAWAEHEGFACLIVELDTPGGLDTSMRQMIKAIFASEIPIIVYVAPSGSRAASAGVFITLAAHIAAMAPGTNIGAAHPVSIGGIGGEGAPDSTMTSKITNDAVAYIRSIAERRGRNAEWAEKAVRHSVSASATEALALHVVDLVANNVDELLTALDGRTVDLDGRSVTLATAGARVVQRQPNLRDQILNVVANPNVAYLLLLLGGLGLFFEFSHPGTMFPGIVGALCLLLAFFGLQMLPVRAAGIALIVLAIILFILEIKVTSYGALAIGGVVALLFGSLMLFERGPGGVPLALDVIIPAVVVFAGLFVFGVVMAIRAQHIRTSTGREGLIGEIGEAQTALAPYGRVFVHGESWQAKSHTPLAAGARVRVVEVDGLTLTVEPAEEEV